MNTREIYFQAYMVSDKPEGKLYYTIMINDNPCVKTSPWFVMDKECHEDNIEVMQVVERQVGFMFWNLSPECDIWLRNKSKGFKTMISALAFQQR